MSTICLLVQNEAMRETATALRTSLARLGVSIAADTHDTFHNATVIVVVDEVTPGICHTIRGLATERHNRVLALLGRVAGPRDAWRLLEYGASDVLSWRSCEATVPDVHARLTRWETIDGLVAADLVHANLIGESSAWIAVLRQIVEVARFTHAPLLIRGETGTGKELAARLVHALDKRPDKGELVLVDCTTLVPELAGSELFGHERGAFTGAASSRDGACALADRGTLFLDEIGELPPRLQSELLRVVQEGSYKRVGSDSWRTARFRLVCATNRDLRREVARGRFRADLFYRIAGVSCTLPPLNERRDDIMLLAEYFIRQSRPEIAASPCVDETVADYLTAREYPGNVRDLRQLIARMLARHAGCGRLTAGDIPVEERPAVDVAAADWRDGAFVDAIRRAIAQGVRLPDIGRAAEEIAIRLALGDSESTASAARRLGVTNRALQLRRAGRRARPARRSEI